MPIIAGGRVLGRSGPWQVGALTMETDDLPSAAIPMTNFSVLRVNRDIFSRSRIGLVATSRNPQGNTIGSNYAGGVDAAFNFKSDFFVNAFWAGSESRASSASSDGSRGQSYRGRFDWNADRYGVNLEHLFVGDGFNPEVGFLRRANFRRNNAQLRFSPRPKALPGVRKLTYQLSADYITGAASGQVETEEYQGQFSAELNNGDFLNAEVTQAFEGIVTPFEVARGVTVPVGGYRFNQARVSYQMGLQRRVSGGITLARGGFYDGTLTEATWRGRVEFTPQLYLEPTLSYNRVEGPFGDANSNLVSSRLTYTVTPRMFVAALVQYQSRFQSVSTNLRFRWEYQLGSELFVVYSDGRTTVPERPNWYPEMQNRSVVVKLTKLFRW